MDEITRLVESLGLTDGADDEQSLALLSIHGRKAVDSLLQAASSAEPRRRAAAVTALGRIGDPRGRRAATLALADRSPMVRAAAATSLAGFPSEAAASRLRGMLLREKDPEVRARAASTLVELFLAGTVEALDTLLTLARDGEEDRRVRLEALKVLGSLPPREARAVAAGLANDPDHRVAQEAARRAASRHHEPDAEMAQALSDLQAPDYFTHRRAATLLASAGEPALPLLVRSLRDHAADPAACARVASVVRELVRGRERALAPMLDDVEETVPLGMLVDIVGASADRAALYHLKGVIDRMAAGDSVPPEAERDARRMIAAKAHHYLARAGSRVAYDALRAALARRDEPLLGETLMAVEEIGGRQDLADLLAHFGREQGWMKDRVRETFRRVMSRSRIRKDDPVLQRLDDAGRRLLEEILEDAPGGGGPPRARPRPRFVDRP
jgi:HEAT repeat protein